MRLVKICIWFLFFNLRNEKHRFLKISNFCLFDFCLFIFIFIWRAIYIFIWKKKKINLINFNDLWRRFQRGRSWLLIYVDLYMYVYTYTHSEREGRNSYDHNCKRKPKSCSATKRRWRTYTIIYKYIREQRNTAPGSTLPRFSSFRMQIYSRRNFPNYIADGIPLDSCLTVR